MPPGIGSKSPGNLLDSPTSSSRQSPKNAPGVSLSLSAKSWGHSSTTALVRSWGSFGKSWKFLPDSGGILLEKLCLILPRLPQGRRPQNALWTWPRFSKHCSNKEQRCPQYPPSKVHDFPKDSPKQTPTLAPKDLASVLRKRGVLLPALPKSIAQECTHDLA